MTYREAERKAKYGGYLHIAWETKDGVWIGERLTPASLKQAMLDSGTQGQFVCFDRAGSSLVWWSLAAMWLRLMKRDMFTFTR